LAIALLKRCDRPFRLDERAIDRDLASMLIVSLLPSSDRRNLTWLPFGAALETQMISKY
jgi:hypothetical protein